MKTCFPLTFIMLALGLHTTAQDTINGVYSFTKTERKETTFEVPQTNVEITQPKGNSPRDVYFLHGLGGSIQSWNLTAEHLELNYQIKEYVPPYGSYVNGNLITAAKEVHDWITVNNVRPQSPSQAILVAHSQGGLVGKAMEYVTLNFPDTNFYPRKFGGIVTFGTPHSGAMILNNGDPYGRKRKIQSFLNEGCQALSSAAISNLVASNWAVSSLVYLLNFDKQLNTSIPEAACDAFSGTLIPLFMDDLASPITTDYNVGSPMVDTLNNMPTPLPIVTFYGEESEPIFFRTLSSFLIDARSLTPQNPYNADDDSEMVKSANRMMSSYFSNYDWEREQARIDRNAAIAAQAAGMLLLPFCPPCAGAAFASAIIASANSQAHMDASLANLRAYFWLHSANDNWLEIIGASKRVVTKDSFVGQCNCNYFTSYGAAFGSNPSLSHLMPASEGQCAYNTVAITLYRFGKPVPANPYACDCAYYDNSSKSGTPLFTQREYGGTCPYGGAYESLHLYRRCQKYYELVQTIVREANDGVVTAASATGYPNAVAIRRMKETNHQQMRNCSETKKAFVDLFLGNIPNTAFFQTNER